MFMVDDSEFDGPIDANPSRTSKYLTSDTSRPSTSGMTNLSLRDIDEDEDHNVRGSDSGSALSLRARMLEKQREIQLSKRQTLAGGQQMIRKSNDGPISASSPARNTDSQTTPAMRQFSQPKATINEDNEPRASTEFNRASRNGPPSAQKPARSSRYSDEDEDVRPSRSGQHTDSRSGGRGNRRSDDDDEYDYRNKKGNTRDRDWDDRDNRDRNRNDSRNDRDYDRPPRDDRSRGRDDSRERYNRDSRDNGRRRDDSRDKYDNREDDRNWSRNSNKSGGRGDDRDDRDDRNYNRNSRRSEYDDDDSRDDRRGGGSSRNSNRSPPRSQDKRGAGKGGDWETSGRSDDRRGGGSNRNGNDSDRDRDNKRGNNKRNSADDDEQLAIAKEVFVPPDYSNMRRFLTSPLPKNNGILQCYIRRNKSGTNKLYPIYSLFLKEGDVFLMASRKRPKNKTSNYLITMDQNDLNRSGNNYLGKLRSNFVGTEFQIFDNGVNPKDNEDDMVRGADASVRCELGAVMYAANVMGSRGPRKMQVALPGLDENNQITKWKDGSGPVGSDGKTSGGEGEMLARMKDRNFKDLVYLINKPPRWNEQVGAYVLNFNGRVTMASVKNFQLVDPDEQNAVVLQFGRVGKDEFTMDFQWPISPYQAFAVTLSSFDSKIACD